MKTKFLLAFFVAILAISFVSAADTVTLVTPAASAYIAGTTYNFSATVATPEEVANVTFYYDDSGNQSICSTLNATEDLTSFSCVASTAGITDGSYTFHAVALDDDDATVLSSDASATVTVDNTDPSVSISIDKTHVLEVTKQRVTCTYSDTTAGVSTATITVVDDEGTSSSFTPTSSGAVTTIGTQYHHELGDYTVTCTIVDNSANSASASTTYDVYPGTLGGEYQEPEPAGGEEQETNWTAIIIVAVIVFIIYLTTKKK